MTKTKSRNYPGGRKRVNYMKITKDIEFEPSLVDDKPVHPAVAEATEGCYGRQIENWDDLLVSNSAYTVYALTI
jgi:hypothetical protein